MIPKVNILTAGSGTRLGDYSKVINKALLPLRGKAIISHIIEKFSPETEFVVAIGFKGQQVVDYLKIAHPEHKFTFVNVVNFDGPGSGPGHSSFCCKNFLSSAFYLVCCDTLWTDDLKLYSTDVNWLGVGKTSAEDSINYCNAIANENKVSELQDKIATKEKEALSFIGLTYIKDTDLFWEGLGTNSIAGKEKQISEGLKNIINKSELFCFNFNWTDVGTEIKYKKEFEKNLNYDFSKPDEFIYIFNDRVIKFFQNAAKAESRLNKSKLNPDVFPLVDRTAGGFYSYPYQKGETLYNQTSPEIFGRLLEWLDNKLWIKKDISAGKMRAVCNNFYYTKTLERIAQFENKYKQPEGISTINKKNIPSTEMLLKKINWEFLSGGEAYFVHGDLQPDNIIFNKRNDQFLLIDWRHDFGGEIEFGDIYYDFAKLWAGLYLNYDQIKAGNFTYEESKNSCEFSFSSHPNFEKTKEILENYLNEKRFSVKKVKLLAGLIYLNMSPLHKHPFDKLLHALGRQFVHELQSED